MNQVAVFLWCLGLVSCLQTMSDDVDINSLPTDDRSYLKQYDQATRDAKVVINFETRYTVDVTYLSPDFRAEFAKRFERLFSAPQPFLEEASSKAGFFVTFFSPSTKGYDLTDEQLWSLQLQADGKTHKPILIKRLDQKERWTPFFPGVHQWSHEYLVLFDTPAQSLNEKMVGKGLMTLSLSNADARTKLVW